MSIDLSKYEKLIRVRELLQKSMSLHSMNLHALLRLQRVVTASIREDIIVLLDRIAKELSRRRVASDEQGRV